VLVLCAQGLHKVPCLMLVVLCYSCFAPGCSYACGLSVSSACSCLPSVLSCSSRGVLQIVACAMGAAMSGGELLNVDVVSPCGVCERGPVVCCLLLLCAALVFPAAGCRSASAPCGRLLMQLLHGCYSVAQLYHSCVIAGALQEPACSSAYGST
jgi:hypothetical protein